jgi:hypothetical protein
MQPQIENTTEPEIDYHKLKMRVYMLERYHKKMAEDENFAALMKTQATERYRKRKEAEKGLTKEEIQTIKENKKIERLAKIQQTNEKRKLKKELNDKKKVDDKEEFKILNEKKSEIRKNIIEDLNALEEIRILSGERRKTRTPYITPPV